MKNINKVVLIIRWIARISSIAIIIMFVVFFIGEGIASDISIITTSEILMLVCIPVILIAGLVVAFKYEILGGSIIIASILVFNVIDVIAQGEFTELEFGLFAIVGILYIICGIVAKRLESPN